MTRPPRYRLPRVRIERTFTDEANRLTAGIVTPATANPRAIGHVFKAYTICYLLSGSGHYSSPSGFACDVSAGDLIQRIPGEPHSLVRNMDGSWYEFYLTLPETVFAGLVRLGMMDPHLEVLHPGVDESTVSQIARYLRWMKDTIDADPRAALLETERLLFELLGRDRARRSRSPDAVAMQRAASALRQGLDERVNMEEFAARVGLGYEKFRKLFAATFGASPKQYRMRYRIDEAKRFLAERRLSIKEIAYRLGYSEVANFANQFKRATGASPGAYRERS